LLEFFPPAMTGGRLAMPLTSWSSLHQSQRGYDRPTHI